MRILNKLFAMVLVLAIVFAMAMPVFATGTKVQIVNMHETEGEKWEKVESITDSYGNTYSSNILKLDASNDAYIAFDLNGNYSSFKGSVVCSTDTGSGASMNIAFFADGKLIYGATDITRQQAAKDIDLDLTGVGLLEIKTSNSGEFSYGWLFLVNSTFEKVDVAEPYNEWAKLSDMVVIDSGRGYEYRMALSKDVMGDLHNGAIKLDASYEDYVLYNLNAKFANLKGNIITFPETGQGANMTVNIYADDKLVFTKSGITKQSSATPLEIDVTGVKVLKITTSNEGEYSYGRVFVVDDILTNHVHTLGDWETTKDATCTENGERVQYCTECTELVKTEAIPANGHTASGKWEVSTEATCTISGERIQICTVCGETAEKETIPATGHTASGKWEVANEATCTAEGEEVQYCTVCAEIADRRSIAKLEHTPSENWEITREATCSKEGIQVKKCTVCSSVVEEELIPTVEHEYGKWTTLSGSAWNPPVIKERECENCGDIDHVEDSSTSWLKPLVIVIFIIAIGGVAVICVTLRMNGLPLEFASVKKLFSKETLSDTDIDDILNKPDAPTGKSSDQTEQ